MPPVIRNALISLKIRMANMQIILAHQPYFLNCSQQSNRPVRYTAIELKSAITKINTHSPIQSLHISYGMLVTSLMCSILPQLTGSWFCSVCLSDPHSKGCATATFPIPNARTKIITRMLQGAACIIFTPHTSSRGSGRLSASLQIRLIREGVFLRARALLR